MTDSRSTENDIILDVPTLESQLIRRSFRAHELLGRNAEVIGKSRNALRQYETTADDDLALLNQSLFLAESSVGYALVRLRYIHGSLQDLQTKFPKLEEKLILTHQKVQEIIRRVSKKNNSNCDPAYLVRATSHAIRELEQFETRLQQARHITQNRIENARKQKLKEKFLKEILSRMENFESIVSGLVGNQTPQVGSNNHVPVSVNPISQHISQVVNSLNQQITANYVEHCGACSNQPSAPGTDQPLVETNEIPPFNTSELSLSQHPLSSQAAHSFSSAHESSSIPRSLSSSHVSLPVPALHHVLPQPQFSHLYAMDFLPLPPKHKQQK